MQPSSVQEKAETQALRRLKFDEHGHAIPLTAAEKAADAEALINALAAIPDDPLEPDEEFWRAMDEGRPERPLFRDLYQP